MHDIYLYRQKPIKVNLHYCSVTSDETGIGHGPVPAGFGASDQCSGKPGFAQSSS